MKLLSDDEMCDITELIFKILFNSAPLYSCKSNCIKFCGAKLLEELSSTSLSVNMSKGGNEYLLVDTYFSTFNILDLSTGN